MGNPETADGYGKAALDAMTDKITETLREALPLLPPLNAEYAAKVADALAVQFAGTPDLPRIVLACAQHLAPLGAEGIHGAIMVHILGAAGLQLDANQAEGTCPGGC
jgi:hypothetical protein